MRRSQKVKVEKADARGTGSKRHKALKRQKNVLERRRAKIDPEVPPGYGRYSGWET